MRKKIRTDEVVGTVLAGGRGSRMGVLTDKQTKPSVSFGGKYRIIDWVLSNIQQTGKMTDTFVMQQYEPASLQQHIGYGREWSFNNYERRVHILWPQQTQEQDEIERWPGTVSPIRQYRDRIFDRGHEAILVLAGDHIYEEDYSRVVRTYNCRGADAVIYVYPARRRLVSQLGVVCVNEELRIVGFHEKPTESDLIESLKLSPETKRRLGVEREEDLWLASMGVYLFDRDVLGEYLDSPEMIDFGRDVIPAMIEGHGVYAHPFESFWADVGTADSYWVAARRQYQRDTFLFEGLTERYQPGSLAACLSGVAPRHLGRWMPRLPSHSDTGLAWGQTITVWSQHGKAAQTAGGSVHREGLREAGAGQGSVLEALPADAPTRRAEAGPRGHGERRAAVCRAGLLP